MPIHRYLADQRVPYFEDFRYLPKELWVNTSAAEGDDYPIVVMPWIEGQTLGEVVRNACHNNDHTYLQSLLVQFIDLAMLLLALPCAHGDLKHDNIIVNAKQQLVLVDYDGMFVPELQGQQANEIGGRDYQHASRNQQTFDRHIDDFSIATIAISLALLAHKPQLSEQYNQGQNLLLRRADWEGQSLTQAPLLQETRLPAIMPLAQHIADTNYYRLPQLFNHLLQLRETPIDIDISAWWQELSIYEKQLIVANYALLKKGIALDFRLSNHIFGQYGAKFGQGIETNALIKAPELPQDFVVIMTKANFRGSSDYGYLYNLNLATPLVNLRELWCDKNRLTDLSPLRSLVNLQKLECWWNQLTDLSPLLSLVNLQQLRCGSNQLTDLSPLGSLVNLQQLRCYSNKLTDLSPLSSLVNLQTLWCGSNQLTDLSPLHSLVNLQELYCSHNKLTDLSPLRSLVNLQELNCWNNRIPDSEIQKLRQYLPKCKIYS